MMEFDAYGKLTSVRSTLRQRSLAAALQVLRREGWLGVTMRAVGEAAGVSAAALYRHFQDKDELWGELVREVGAVFRDYLFDGMEAETPAGRLWGALEAVRRFAVEEPKYYELLMSTRVGRPGLAYPERYRDSPPRTFRMLVELVEACMESGDLARDDAMEVALTLASHAHGVIRLHRLGRFGDDAEGFARFYGESFARVFQGLATSDRSIVGTG